MNENEKTTPIANYRQGHSCNLYAGLGSLGTHGQLTAALTTGLELFFPKWELIGMASKREGGAIDRRGAGNEKSHCF